MYGNTAPSLSIHRPKNQQQLCTCAVFVQETKAWWEAYPRNVEELLNKAYLRNVGQCTPRDIMELKVLLPQIEIQREIGKKRMNLEKLIEECKRLGGKKWEGCKRLIEEMNKIKLAG